MEGLEPSEVVLATLVTGARDEIQRHDSCVVRESSVQRGVWESDVCVTLVVA